MKTFKKLYAIAFICIVAFACSSDDSNSGANREFIGTWKFTDSSSNGVEDADNYICDFEDTYVINAISVTISSYEDPSGEDGSNCQLDGAFTFNYTIDGNIITNTEEGFSSEIIRFNNTTLIFSNTETSEGTVLSILKPIQDNS
mgnify:CR=1 FL=1|tara:strand:+ start:339 stop:770 length:432 start_codon:yes stop_codon:yes gene_type:complete